MERRGELGDFATTLPLRLMTAYRRVERHHDVERVATRIFGLDPYDEGRAPRASHSSVARSADFGFEQLQRCRQSLRQGLSVRPTAETEHCDTADRVPHALNHQHDAPLEAGQREGVLSTKLDHSVMASRAPRQLRRAQVREPSLIVTPLEVLGEGTRAHFSPMD